MYNELSSREPLTVVVQRRISPGSEARFEELMQGFIGFALRQPGHLGINVLRPSHGSRDYTVVAVLPASKTGEPLPPHQNTGNGESVSWRFPRVSPLFRS